MRVELIDFREPEDGQLYVTRIKWDKDSDQLYELLRERFSKFGLLHMVKVYRGGNDIFLDVVLPKCLLVCKYVVSIYSIY